MNSTVSGHETELTPSDYKRISDVIYKHCGINLHEGKHNLVRARLAKRMRIKGFQTFKDYLDYALTEPPGEEFTALVDAISTNLTCFFREIAHFNYLETHFLPDRINQYNNEGKSRIRIWSAGCSSGEEPYSIAICLRENVPPNWDIKILASDVSTDILRRAQTGIYDKVRLEPLSMNQKQRFFQTTAQNGVKSFRVKNELKNLIRFRYVNLIQPWPFSGQFDIIFCRNVMIYFDKTTQEKLINRFWDHLLPGGLLCIGHSESLTGINHKFRYIQPATYAKP